MRGTPKQHAYQAFTEMRSAKTDTESTALLTDGHSDRDDVTPILYSQRLPLKYKQELTGV